MLKPSFADIWDNEEDELVEKEVVGEEEENPVSAADKGVEAIFPIPRVNKRIPNRVIESVGSFTRAKPTQSSS